MKKYTILQLIAALCLFMGGCQDVETVVPDVATVGISSITATFEDGSGNFKGIVEEGKNEIIIVIPYYYPENTDNVMTMDKFTNMRMSASLADNVTISPALLYMDLTKENVVTIRNQRKESERYIVKGEIRKSTACLLEEFNLPGLGISGVIDQDKKTVSLVSTDNIGEVLADVTLSYHATISPDPRTVALNYDEDVQLTVTAHDGVTKSVYTVQKRLPEKLNVGIRKGSVKELFIKKLNADLGITTANLTGGMAAIGKYIVLNTRAEKSIYIDAKTGEKVGEIDLGAITGNLINFNTTGDEAGNILICNLSPNDDAHNKYFKIWKIAGVTGTPQELISYENTPQYGLGRKFSVRGSVDGDAIITAPIVNTTAFARWTIVGGQVTSQTPEIVTVTGPTVWGLHCDVIYTSATDVNSDYFVVSYADNTAAWVNGVTNVTRQKLDPLNTNFYCNTVDYVEFNKGKYMSYAWVNPWTWGDADRVFMLNVSSLANYTGAVATEWGWDSGNPVVEWASPYDGGVTGFGPKYIGQPANGNGTADVAFRVSDNGYYLYLYFMFTNGCIAGYQFDCIDL